MSPQAYLRQLQLKAFNSNYRLAFHPVDPRSEKARDWILRAKGVLNPDIVAISESDINYLQRLAQLPPWMRLDPMAEKIYSQSFDLIRPQDAAKLSKAAVGFLPTGIINACCIGGLSDGYVVAINYGLYYTFILLSIALIAPDTTGEVLQDALESVYPEEILKASINCAIRPSPDNYEILERHYSYMTPELLGLVSFGVNHILQFIFLHEVGHICNGDVDKGQALAIFDFDDQRLAYT